MLIIPQGVTFRFNSTLQDADGSPVDLSTAQAVQVKLRPPSGNVVTLTATVDNAAAGKLHADASAAQLATVGTWAAWAVATWADGRVVKSYGLPFVVAAEGAGVTNV